VIGPGGDMLPSRNIHRRIIDDLVESTICTVLGLLILEESAQVPVVVSMKTAIATAACVLLA
jgi:hypothetical protein